MKTSIGLIETIGLAAAVEAADAATKAANVTLDGMELTKGGGMVVVKLIGDVGAIKAAVSAGGVAAARVSRVYAAHVIARPHEALDNMIASPENMTMNCVKKVQVQTKVLTTEHVQEIGEICNLCGDPCCSRKKGEPKINCIHNKEKENKEE
ncbi:MAG: BMC domain-containing protein [Clostridia bacterium]|nr:BMC domain-containing protein [Clostridia bacterium]